MQKSVKIFLLLILFITGLSQVAQAQDQRRIYSDFQKLELGRQRWSMTSVNLREVIEEAVSATGQLVAEKKIDMQLHLPDEVQPLEGDRDQLIQAMVNLISNAVKFCKSEVGRIDIRLEIDAQDLTVSVADNGIGISVADQQHIFDRFHQVVDPSRGRPAGTGLGLSITRRIIRHHQGELQVRSQPGKGATFSFSLPYKGASTDS